MSSLRSGRTGDDAHFTDPEVTASLTVIHDRDSFVHPDENGVWHHRSSLGVAWCRLGGLGPPGGPLGP